MPRNALPGRRMMLGLSAVFMPWPSGGEGGLIRGPSGSSRGPGSCRRASRLLGCITRWAPALGAPFVTWLAQHPDAESPREGRAARPNR